MTLPPDEDTPGARHLARGITATWWYTAGAVILFEVMVVLMWLPPLAVSATAAPHALPRLVVAGAAGIVFVAATVWLLARRRRPDAHDPSRAAHALAWAAAIGFGAAAGVLTHSWVVALMPAGQLLVLMRLPRGVRGRAAVLVSLALVVLLIAEGGRMADAYGQGWWAAAVFTAGLPAMTASSLWWWEVLVALDRARESEGRLAAAQERLRVATDVHDLQGHHLQVIALQLELAERLLDKDPQAARTQITAARTSVDEARQGTRELATRFRSVPLPDELANAGDLLEAAGLRVDLRIADDATDAPADVLGPIIRETTTNTLKHGAGGRASLRLERTATGWRYAIANDAQGEHPAPDGAGIAGIERRLAEAGGVLEVRRGDRFEVVAEVPAAPVRRAGESVS